MARTSHLVRAEVSPAQILAVAITFELDEHNGAAKDHGVRVLGDDHLGSGLGWS